MSRFAFDLDMKLVKEGLARTHCRTKEELIHFALRELLKMERRKDILLLRGKVHWRGNLRAWRENHC